MLVLKAVLGRARGGELRSTGGVLRSCYKQKFFFMNPRGNRGYWEVNLRGTDLGIRNFF